MVYVTCKLSSEAFILENFHMEKTTSSAFWDAFVPAYFGPDADPEAVERDILPFAGLKTLIIERDTGTPMPEFRAALSSILK